MSVEELRFKCEDDRGECKFKFENGELCVYDTDVKIFTFERGEAHLLMLYLQEHLK